MFVDTNQPIDREHIERLLLAAAPERKSDIQALWDRYKPEFWLKPDKPGITLLAKGNQIHFSAKTLAAVWFLGFAAWKIFACHSPHLLWSFVSKQDIDDEMLRQDDGLYEAKGVFREILATVEDLLKASSLDDVNWPSDIPQQQADKTGFDTEQQATFDVTMIATAYLLLHELKHVMFSADDAHRPEAPQEELACDAFAKDFLLSKSASFAASSCYPPGKVLTKRAMGVALGAFIVYELTPPEGRAGNADYPPICDRLEHLMTANEVDGDSYFWDWTGTILLATLHRIDAGATVPQSEPHETCKYLIDAIREKTF